LPANSRFAARVPSASKLWTGLGAYAKGTLKATSGRIARRSENRDPSVSGASPCQGRDPGGQSGGRTSGRDRKELQVATGAVTAHEAAAQESVDQGKRDFLYIASAAFGAVGAVAAIAPFITQLSPDAETIAAGAPIDVDLGPIAEGQIMHVVWRSKPIFVRHLTAKELDESKSADWHDMIDPAPEQARVKDGHDQWLVVIGICTHLGCIPLDKEGPYGGWKCPCHGSLYDPLGRVRHGPAPANLAIPPYAFLSDTKIRIG
jgi:ubiquinol-cytochrome c reductase iron-sulfur subunit